MLTNLKGQLNEQPKKEEMMLQFQWLCFTMIYSRTLNSWVLKPLKKMSDGFPTSIEMTDIQQIDISNMQDKMQCLNLENKKFKKCTERCTVHAESFQGIFK